MHKSDYNIMEYSDFPVLCTLGRMVSPKGDKVAWYELITFRAFIIIELTSVRPIWSTQWWANPVELPGFSKVSASQLPPWA